MSDTPIRDWDTERLAAYFSPADLVASETFRRLREADAKLRQIEALQRWTVDVHDDEGSVMGEGAILADDLDAILHPPKEAPSDTTG